MYKTPHTFPKLWENSDYIPVVEMQTKNASLTMCTLRSICVYFYMHCAACGCDCEYVFTFDLVSICILFRSSKLAAWWSLKHGNPGLICSVSPRWSTNGNPGGLQLHLAQRWNYRIHTHTDMYSMHIADFSVPYLFTQISNWHDPPYVLTTLTG